MYTFFDQEGEEDMKFDKSKFLFFWGACTLLLFTSGNAAGYSIDIHGPVYEGTDLQNIIGPADIDFIEMNAENFAGFYYDADQNVSTETLRVYGGIHVSEIMIEENGIVYSTNVKELEYRYRGPEWEGSTYPVLGLFGEQYVPLKNNTPDKLTKLLMDSDSLYSVEEGKSLELDEGYSIFIRDVDVDGEKAWLEFRKDGEEVANKTIAISGEENGNWFIELDDVEQENNVVVLRLHVKQVYWDGSSDNAQIEGLWLIDYANAFTLEPGEEFGTLELNSVSGTGLEFRNKNPVTLSRDSLKEISENLKFRVADTPMDELRFYLMREYGPGTYEIRGEVAENEASFMWNGLNFAGLSYDIDEDLRTESLQVINDEIGPVLSIPEGGLVYATSIGYAPYTCREEGWDSYPFLKLFDEFYVPLSPNTPDKLATLLLDNDRRVRLKSGATLELGSGYNFTLTQIDGDGKKVWVEFSKDGVMVDDEILEISGPSPAIWDLDRDGIEGENDVMVFRTKLKNISRTEEGDFAVFQGFWLIDYANAFTIESDDEFGVLETTTVSGNSLELSNYETIILERGNVQEIANNLKLRVAENGIGEPLRYYPFVEWTVLERVPATYYVGEGEISDYETIEQAVENALDRDTIIVYPGVYTENINVSTELTIISESGNPGDTVVQAADPARHVFYVNANNVKLSGFTVKGATFALNPYEASGIYLDNVKNDIVVNNKISGNFDGVFVNNSSNISVTGNTFDSNTFAALKVVSSSENKASNNIALNNKYGILLSLSDDNNLTNNRLNNNQFGIDIWNSDNGNLINRNNCSNNTIGCEISDSENNTFVNNILYSNSWKGLDLGTSIGNTICNNTISGNEEGIEGITLLWDSKNNVICNNTISNKDGVGIRLVSSGENTIYNNYFNNTVNVKLENSGVNTWNITKTPGTNIVGGSYLGGNFWAIPDGSGWSQTQPDSNEDGICDSPYEIDENNTDYLPLTVYVEEGDDTNEDNENDNVNDNANDNVNSGGGGSSSSGGGGGGSPESARNVEIKELSQQFVTNGKHVKFEFLQAVTCVNCVEFDAMRTVGRTTTVVEMLKEKSTLTSYAPEGEIYRYLNIWVGNSGFASPENVAEPCVGFKVEKAWIAENGIKETTICLCRYSEGKWDRLPTVKEGEDQNYLHFKASTPGFSPFAITGEKESSITESETGEKLAGKDAGMDSESSSVAVSDPYSEKPAAEGESAESKTMPGIGIIPGCLTVILAGRALGKKR